MPQLCGICRAQFAGRRCSPTSVVCHLLTSTLLLLSRRSRLIRAAPGPLRCSLVARVCPCSRCARAAVCPARGARGVGEVGGSRPRAASSSRYGFNGWVRPPPKPPEPEILTLLSPHVVVFCSPNFHCGLTPISDPGCPQLKNYYSPIWIAMRWYKARAFMRHHKTSEPRQRRLR